MKKALNFDLDTKKYEEITGRSASTAYYELRKFLEKKEFIHRQGSGYVSKISLTDIDIVNIVSEMANNLVWLKDCIKQLDVTNVGKQYSLITMVNEASSSQEIDYRHSRNDINNIIENDYELEI